jgi:hypothetical protein
MAFTAAARACRSTSTCDVDVSNGIHSDASGSVQSAGRDATLVDPIRGETVTLTVYLKHVAERNTDSMRMHR